MHICMQACHVSKKEKKLYKLNFHTLVLPKELSSLVAPFKFLIFIQDHKSVVSFQSRAFLWRH